MINYFTVPNVIHANNTHQIARLAYIYIIRLQWTAIISYNFCVLL